MISRRLFVLVLGLVYLIPMEAQRDRGYRFADGFFWGFKAGATYSSLDGLRNTLIDPVYPEELFSTADEPRLGGTVAFFIDYRHSSDAYLAGRLELGYTMQGGSFTYEDANGLNYELGVNYDYLTITPLIKLNIPPDWPYVLAGIQFGVNLSGQNLTYSSNDDPGIDLQVQQSLRDVLKGRSNTGLVAGIGFELTRSGLYLEGRYTLGLTDVIETQPNGFLFIETPNRMSYWQVTVGMPIAF